MSRPTQPVQQPAPPRAKARPDVQDIMQEADDWWLQLRRVLAGYKRLHGALLTFQNAASPEERRVGLPIFEFPATATGRDTVKVVVDLQKHVEAQHVPHVLIPMINSLGAQVQESLDELRLRIDLLEKTFAGVAQPAGGPPAVAGAEPMPTEEAYERQQ